MKLEVVLVCFVIGACEKHETAQPVAAIASSAPSAEPKIVQGQVIVSGRLPPEVVQRVVRDGFAGIRSCWADAFRKNPTLKGRVAVKYVIGRDGSVMDARDAASDLPDPDVVTCVVGAFRKFSYPQPEGGIVVVEWPMFFNTLP